MVSKYIEAVGFQEHYGADQVKEFGKRVLLPSVELVDKSKIQYFGELKATAQFLDYLNQEMAKYEIGYIIKSPADVWRLSTFITYIGDERDISVLDSQMALGRAPVVPNSGLNPLNITQAANFTLAAFSGDCNDWARLYAAMESVVCKQPKYFQVYSVFFTPIDPHKTGHTTNLWSTDNEIWHIYNFQYEYIFKGSPWNVAYLWAEIYGQGWSDYAVTICKNVFINPFHQSSVESYIPPIASAKIDYLVGNGYVQKDLSVHSINHITDKIWNGYQAAAAKIFDLPFITTLNNEVGNDIQSSPLKKFENLVSSNKNIWYLLILILILSIIKR